jgi:hypothetical protein
MTTQQQSLPSRVGCSVMPVTCSRFGPSAVNLRLTRSVTVFWAGTRLARRRSGSPEIPAAHEQRHRLAADDDAVCLLQLGADAGLAVGAV